MKQWLVLGCALWASVTHAALLDIEITQGREGAIPVSVLPFERGPIGDQIAAVIRQDLNNSGLFAAKGMPPMPFEVAASEIENSFWQGIGIDHVIRGKIQTVGDKLNIELVLTDVYGKRQGKNGLIFTQKYENISRNSWRALAHHMSDKIYERLTGTKGAFSTRIAYVLVNREDRYTHQLEISDYDGHSPQVVLRSPEPIMSPSWSPDGKSLAFVSFENKRSEIYILDVASGQRRKMSHFPGINGAPAWAPDGETIAMALSKDGAPNLYQMSVRTGALKRLTQGTSIDTEPSYSPDGKSIVFTSNRGGTPQIYKLTLATGQVERLTFQGDYNARASFTPDGKGLVMIHRPNGMDYCIAHLDMPSKRINLLTKAKLDESPSLAPNGSMVLYGTQLSGRTILGAVSIDGYAQLRLPVRKGNVQEPAWSPFLS